jgi:hypothetical protein
MILPTLAKACATVVHERCSWLSAASCGGCKKIGLYRH